MNDNIKSMRVLAEFTGDWIVEALAEYHESLPPIKAEGQDTTEAAVMDAVVVGKHLAMNELARILAMKFGLM